MIKYFLKVYPDFIFVLEKTIYKWWGSKLERHTFVFNKDVRCYGFASKFVRISTTIIRLQENIKRKFIMERKGLAVFCAFKDEIGYLGGI